MFVRFRMTARRLDLSLIEAVRRDGKPRQEYVAGLGSIPQPPSVAERIAFWRKLHDRLAKLSNRLDAESQGRILGEVHARVPMVTAKEQRELQLANAVAEAETWGAVASYFESVAAESKGLIASAEQQVAANGNAARSAAELAEAAKDKLTRIERGESVGGLGKKPNLNDILRELGFTRADMRKAMSSAALTEEQFEAVLAEKLRRQLAASDWMPRDDSALAAVVAAHRRRRGEGRA